MKVKATLDFIHPFDSYKAFKDRVYEVHENDGNETLLRIGYWAVVKDEITEVTEINKGISELKFRSQVEQAKSIPLTEKIHKEEIEEKELKEERTTKEAKVRRKTK